MSNEAPETETQTKLRELQEKRAALQAAREAAEAKRAEARELAQAEQALLDEQALQDAIAEHGDIGVGLATLQTSMGLIILRKASDIRFRRFQDTDKPKAEDVLKLVSPCVVHPSAARFSVIMKELPAALMLLASLTISLAGQAGDDFAKK